MSPLAPALAAVVIVARALTSDRPSTGWLLIAAGQAFWSGGAFYYAIVLWDADPMPFPSSGRCELARLLSPHPRRRRPPHPRPRGGARRHRLVARRSDRRPCDQRGGRRTGLWPDRRCHRRINPRDCNQSRVPPRRPGRRRDHGRRPGDVRLAARPLLDAARWPGSRSSRSQTPRTSSRSPTARTNAALSKPGGCAPARSWRSLSGSRGQSRAPAFKPGARSSSRRPSARSGCPCSSTPPSARCTCSRSCWRRRVWSR